MNKNEFGVAGLWYLWGLLLEFPFFRFFYKNRKPKKIQEKNRKKPEKTEKVHIKQISSNKGENRADFALTFKIVHSDCVYCID